MAIGFNDNIYAQVNRPLDFKFGPFDSVAQANSYIPIAQRYHGLIFGVYTNPGNIATSDVDFYYYWNSLADTNVYILNKWKDVGSGNVYRNSSVTIGGINDPTNKLDIVGDLRVRTILNLGTAATNILVPNANGVLSLRTASELRSDIGAIGGTGTTNQLAYFTASATLASLSTATYPSLTELSYVKGVTSSIQTQLNARVTSNIYSANGTLAGARTVTLGGFSLDFIGTATSRFFANGNVGIGTTTDVGFRLDINGTARVQGLTEIRTLASSFNFPLTVENTGSAAVGNKNVALFIGNRGNASNIDDNTNIGLQQKSNITNNFGTFNFYNSSAGLTGYFGIQYGSHSASPIGTFVFGVTNSGTPVEAMRITPTRNLLINTTTDAGYLLDVNGTARIQSNLEVAGQVFSPVNSKGSSGTGTVTFNWNDANIQSVTLTGSCTFAFSNPQSGASYQIVITQNATGGFTITWPTIHWANKTIPSLTGTANSVDIVTLTYDGSKYLGVISKNHGTP